MSELSQYYDNFIYKILNNPMVGATVAVAVDVATALSK